MLNRLDAGNEREAIITVWKWFAIQIDGVDLGTRNGEQFIRVVASERTKRIVSSNQPQQFSGPAPHIEVVSTGWQRRRSGDCPEDCSMNPGCAEFGNLALPLFPEDLSKLLGNLSSAHSEL